METGIKGKYLENFMWNLLFRLFKVLEIWKKNGIAFVSHTKCYIITTITVLKDGSAIILQEK